MKIPILISDEEILVRYIFDSDFKKKNISHDRIDSANIFQPYGDGVSLQRQFFCKENECKVRAKRIEKKYVGFIVFRKKRFEEVKSEYIRHERSDFRSKIIPTPLDDEGRYLTELDDSFIENQGNPSHADLRYINPAPMEGETPKTAIRSFSRKLYKDCCLILDEDPSGELFNNQLFIDAV